VARSVAWLGGGQIPPRCQKPSVPGVEGGAGTHCGPPWSAGGLGLSHREGQGPATAGTGARPSEAPFPDLLKVETLHSLGTGTGKVTHEQGCACTKLGTLGHWCLRGVCVCE
jgi:hypothetical protein